MEKIYDLIIVGGGAAGLIAACAAADAAGGVPFSILIIEKNERLAKKILSTGNGRCNLTNTDIRVEFYHSEKPDFVKKILSICGVGETLAFFKKLGLLTVTEEGRVYPYSKCASSVSDVLRASVIKNNIHVEFNMHANKIIFDKKHCCFFVFCNGKTFSARSVIVSAGGCAAPHTGSDGSGFNLLSDFGFKINPVFPALTGIKVKDSIKYLKGVRVDAALSASSKNAGQKKERGEIIFTDFGVSGIPALNLSGFLNNKQDPVLFIDFFPNTSENDLLIDLRHRNFAPEQIFTGILHKHVAQAILSRVKKSGDFYSQTVEQSKKFLLSVSGVMDFKHAQVTGGGIDLGAFDPETMESREHPSFYAAGEVLDVYGDCGGYNLQWAWTTGIVAGRNAAKKTLSLKGTSVYPVETHVNPTERFKKRNIGSHE